MDVLVSQEALCPLGTWMAGATIEGGFWCLERTLIVSKWGSDLILQIMKRVRITHQIYYSACACS